MIQEFCKACMVTLKNQGNVLIPSLPTGKIYDLIEYLYRFVLNSIILFSFFFIFFSKHLMKLKSIDLLSEPKNPPKFLIRITGSHNTVVLNS